MGSVTVGQDEIWEIAEAEKEGHRRDNNWRYSREYYRPTRWRPYGNPGPGVLAKVVQKTRTGKVTFAWNRERQSHDERQGEPIRTTFVCSVREVLNVDAYKPGDFHIFFDDPRTRRDYLQWAPLLLEAEEYHAGNREVLEPPSPKPKRPSSWEGRRQYARLKLRKELTGKAVRLVRDIEMVDGTTYRKGSLWRVTGGAGAYFSIAAINEDGSRKKENRAWVDRVEADDFKVDPSIPEEKG